MTETVDVLYLAWNRLEFTRTSFSCLLENTAWERVRRLVVVDDGSTDGTADWLYEACTAASGIEIEFEARERDQRFGSPVAAMADYLAAADSDRFAKVDNDVAVPPGWLEALLQVAEETPAVDLLGFEAGMTILPAPSPGSLSVPDGWDGRYGFRPSSHIGGVGLMRTGAFRDGPALRAQLRYFGFTEWQNRPGVERGWIEPDLRAPLLDRIPVQPFSALSASYVKRGWQRSWRAYNPGWMSWAYEWVVEREGARA